MEEQQTRFHHQALDLSCDDPSYPSRDLQQSCWGATVNCKFVSTDHPVRCCLSHLMMGLILCVKQIKSENYTKSTLCIKWEKCDSQLIVEVAFMSLLRSKGV
jgi:hypothetical protein